MPELPEVETIRRGLHTVLVGKKIKTLWSDWPKKIEPSLALAKRLVAGKKIMDVKRRAKVIVICLSGGYSILIHLKMSGQLIYKPKRGELVVGGHPQVGGLHNLPNAFTHHTIAFFDTTTLYFNDQRKFGWLKVCEEQAVAAALSHYGVEPFDDAFTGDFLRTLCRRYPRRTIKQLLLDQTGIAGLGNIYVDESLFHAGIQPQRRAEHIRVVDARRLCAKIQKVIRAAVEHGGTSIDTLYVNHAGAPGRYAQFLRVYGRDGLPCKVCKSIIKRIKLGGRGTHYCPTCQK